MSDRDKWLGRLRHLRPHHPVIFDAVFVVETLLKKPFLAPVC